MSNDRDQQGKKTGEWQLRRDLAACFRLAAHYGWDDLIANHFSVRLPGKQDAFLINPLGLLFEQVTASSLLKIDTDGNLLAPSDYQVNRPGFVIHSALHRARPEVNCIMHLHSRDGVAVSALKAGLLPLNQNAMTILGDLAYHEYEGVVTDAGEQVRMRQHLGGRNLMLLRNHGTLTLGQNICAAFYRMYLLETACAIQVRTLSMNADLHAVPASVQEKVARQINPALLEQAEPQIWPTLLRKVERLYPDFAN